MPGRFIQECEALGLFQTRMPRFTQLFFHDFCGREVALEIGQSETFSCRQRAAKAFLTSGARLESKCGLSDIWYHFVETNRHLFEGPEELAQIETKPHHSHHLRLDMTYAESIYNLFEWSGQPTRPPLTGEEERIKQEVEDSALEVRMSLSYISEEVEEGRVEQEVEDPVLEDRMSSSEISEEIQERGVEQEVKDPAPEDQMSSSEVSDEVEERGVGQEVEDPVLKDRIGLSEEFGVKQEEMDYFEFDVWPPSFEKALAESLDAVERTMTAPCIPTTNPFKPPSIPKERKLHADPGFLDTSAPASCLGRVTGTEVARGGVPMEGIELTQSSQEQISDASDLEEATEEPNECYTHHGECAPLY